MNDKHLKEAEDILKEYDRRDNMDMGSLSYSAMQSLIEYCKQLEERVKELEGKK